MVVSSLADPAILWQGVSVLITADCPPRFASAHAINRAMIVASSSETELDFANHRAGISSAALVNRFIVRVVSVTVRIIAVGIVPVVWIGTVKERVPKIVKEEEPVVEVSMAESIAPEAAAAKATSVKTTAKATSAKTTTGETAVKTAAIEATAAKAPSSSTEAAAVTTATPTVRHHV